MRRSRLILLVSSFAIIAVVAVGVATQSGDSDEEKPATGGIELAGMKMSRSEVTEMTRDSMGEVDLESVEEAGPDDAESAITGKLVGNTRTFELTAQPIRWEYRDGQRVAAWGYNGQIPGPALTAREGERIRVEFQNDLPVATTLHWHGVDVPWEQDGVPGVTQQAIKSGESFTYEFTATPAGTRWYHTHGGKMGEEAGQLDMGLSGALVIAPKRARPAAQVDKVLVLDDWSIGQGGYNASMMAGHGGHGGEYNVYTINGRAMPDIPDIVVKEGQTVRLRYVNASTMSIHPMHLHGHQFKITALDGNPVPTPFTRNVNTLNPGETMDIEFVANNPGVWMIHCHELHHADGGMGMLLRYEGYEPVGDDAAEEHEGDEDGDGDDSQATSDMADGDAMAGMEH